MGKARQLHVHRRAVGAPRKGNPEDLGGGYGIIAEGLVEVTDAKEEDSIGVLGFEFQVLLHHRGLCNLLCHRTLTGLCSCVKGGGNGRGRDGVWRGLLLVLGQDVTKKLGEELPARQAAVVDDDALDLTTGGEAAVHMEDVLMKDELGRAHRTAQSRAVMVSAAQALLVGDGDLGDEGVESIFVHLPEVHAQTLEELVARVLHIMLVVGVIDDALQVALVVAHLHLEGEKVFQWSSLD